MANVFGTDNNDFIHLAGDGAIVTGLHDVPTATSGNDVIYAKAGDDLIRGGGGVDVMYGGVGNDTFILREALDLAVGERYIGGDGTDWLDGGAVTTAVSLDGVYLSSIEGLYGFGAGLSLHASQLAGKQFLNTGTLTVLDSGVIDLTFVQVVTTKIVLSNFGNDLTLTLSSNTATGFIGFHGNVYGGALADRI